MINPTPRLIAISGKGGVGKTVYSLAKTLQLAQKQDVVYINFEHSPIPIPLNNKNYIELNMTDSTSEYIARKLGSKSIASWVTSAKFFQALYGMLPGLSHMIMLGHILDILEKNPTKVIVLDCPASGHFLSILNIPAQFKSIFGIGAIVNDINRMLTMMNDPNFFQIEILTLASELSLQESLDTILEIKKLGFPQPKHIINNIFGPTLKDWNNTPQYFKEKIKQEVEMMKNNNFYKSIPHLISNTPLDLINQIKEVL